ncbi:hypothetical protein XELAEV_180135681mg, partial [Xenopus laevis]
QTNRMNTTQSLVIAVDWLTKHFAGKSSEKYCKKQKSRGSIRYCG